MFISAEKYKHDMNAFICLYLFIPSISVHICTYACICSYVCICQYPSISVHICAYVYICKHVCICLYKFISVHMCTSVHMVVSVNIVHRFRDQPRINPESAHMCPYLCIYRTYPLISVYINAYMIISIHI